MSEIIHLKNISVRRSGKPVLRHVNWTTRKGEHWFIMGANGSGKTTLVEVLMGYLWPQEGEVRLLGETFGRTLLPELRARVGYVSPWVFKRTPPDTLVEDVVASGMDASIGFYGRKTRKLRLAVKRQLTFFGCQGLSGRTFGTLSSGQQLKVVLARALVHEPVLLILDEPFSLLDIGTRVRTYELLTKLSRQKHTPQMVIVTHHREDVLPFLTHGLLLKDGQVWQKGLRRKMLNPKVLSGALNVQPGIMKKYFF